jgi:hypothetical protein
MLSLETCLKLKEAGWAQGDVNCPRSHFAYVPSGHASDRGQPVLIYTPESNIRKFAACPTLDELLEAVRTEADSIHNGTDDDLDVVWYLELHDEGDRYSAHQVPISDKWAGITIEHTDPSEAVAALWLKLKAGSE